ncbi:hypothetical protein LOAG_17720 [Loa loa]|uniref:Lipoprotein n=3 Tax=Loa loa TaxID=7209 RepID=A0A1I7VEI6_LOALO|nr:hypothetical protein LOAG_17720 [Loa loa]EJD75069.1 hypothetical protein LOAG_17720 [Loa loa]
MGMLVIVMLVCNCNSFFSVRYRNINDQTGQRISEDKLKLLIVISNDDEGAKSEALNAVEEIRKQVVSAPICVVAQSDNRDNNKSYNNFIGNGRVLMFYGPDVKASILLVNKKDTSEMLKTKFENWKKELLFLNSHQVIAFHFTVVNGTEPEDNEEIFSNTFPDIPLSTLRLLDESSMTGVDYQVETEFRFDVGPVYAIVGFRQFGRKSE